MSALGPIESAEAARALSGDSLSTVAQAIGTTATRLKAEHDQFGGVLTEAEVRALRRHYWARGIFTIDLPWVVGALTFPPLSELRTILRMAELWPDTTNDGWRFRLIARLWRSWLRLRGLGHRIADSTSLPTREPGSPPGEAL
jgi:hypothetical protein